MNYEEEILNLLKNIEQIGKDLKIEMHNIRKSLDKIDDTIQEGFYLDWPEEEEVENEETH